MVDWQRLQRGTRKQTNPGPDMPDYTVYLHVVLTAVQHSSVKKWAVKERRGITPDSHVYANDRNTLSNASHLS